MRRFLSPLSPIGLLSTGALHRALERQPGALATFHPDSCLPSRSASCGRIPVSYNSSVTGAAHTL
jgi:hypothetical protein